MGDWLDNDWHKRVAQADWQVISTYQAKLSPADKFYINAFIAAFTTRDINGNVAQFFWGTASPDYSKSEWAYWNTFNEAWHLAVLYYGDSIYRTGVTTQNVIPYGLMAYYDPGFNPAIGEHSSTHVYDTQSASRAEKFWGTFENGAPPSFPSLKDLYHHLYYDHPPDYVASAAVDELDLTGTVTTGSEDGTPTAQVLGDGTHFLTDLLPGDVVRFVPDLYGLPVRSIQDDTHLTLAAPYMTGLLISGRTMNVISQVKRPAAGTEVPPATVLTPAPVDTTPAAPDPVIDNTPAPDNLTEDSTPHPVTTAPPAPASSGAGLLIAGAVLLLLLGGKK